MHQYRFLYSLPRAETGKGPSPKGMRGTHLPGSAAEQVRDCHTLKGVLRCVYMQYDIILHFVPFFKPVFLLSVQISVGAA